MEQDIISLLSHHRRRVYIQKEDLLDYIQIGGRLYYSFKPSRFDIITYFDGILEYIGYEPFINEIEGRICELELYKSVI